MVDIERRRKLALHLRHLSIGVISNDDFEESLMNDVTNGWLPEQYYKSEEAKFDDKIVQPMLELCWGLYDDNRNHKLRGSDKLPEQSLKIIARCVLFLHADKEYEWPYFDTKSPLVKFSLGEVILTILFFGHYYRDIRKQQEKAFEEFQKLGDFEIWPFINQNDYDEQLKHQPFLK